MNPIIRDSSLSRMRHAYGSETRGRGRISMGGKKGGAGWAQPSSYHSSWLGLAMRRGFRSGITAFEV